MNECKNFQMHYFGSLSYIDALPAADHFRLHDSSGVDSRRGVADRAIRFISSSGVGNQPKIHSDSFFTRIDEDLTSHNEFSACSLVSWRAEGFSACDLVQMLTILPFVMVFDFVVITLNIMIIILLLDLASI
jgi:hypothetical protein